MTTACPNCGNAFYDALLTAHVAGCKGKIIVDTGFGPYPTTKRGRLARITHWLLRKKEFRA